MDVHTALSINLKTLRKARKLTQEKLAHLSGLHRAQVGHIEQRRHNPTIGTLEKIAAALNVEVALLLVDPACGSFLAKPEKGKSVLDNCAICTLTDGYMSITQLDSDDLDLSGQVLKALVEQGWDGDDLIAKYEEVFPQIQTLVSSREGD